VGRRFATLDEMEREKTEPSPLDTVAPPRNFTLSIEDRLRAYAQGAPSYIRRRRRIEDIQARLLAKLSAAATPAEVAASAPVVEELALLNELIGRHNRYYPIEAQLPIDIRAGHLLERGLPWQPLAAVTAADLLARATQRR